MLSPLTKRNHSINQSVQNKSQSCLKSGCSTWSPHSCQDYQEKYLVFKRKLLEAMVTMDSLSLLESGIFQEYESSFTEHCCENKNGIVSPKVSHFETNTQSFTNKINTYAMDGLTVTQVERRSRSCQRTSRQERLIRNVQEQRNVEFVLFHNLINQLTQRQQHQDKQIYQEKQNDMQESSPTLEIQTKQNYEIQQANMSMKIEQLQNEKEHLEKQLRECLTKLQHQKAISLTMKNQKTNKQLQFLLKEKQLIKKIHQYKEENQRLRANEQNSQNTMMELSRPTETVRIITKEGNRIDNLKEKVANEGRVRWALSKAWAAELSDECK